MFSRSKRNGAIVLVVLCMWSGRTPAQSGSTVGVSYWPPPVSQTQVTQAKTRFRDAIRRAHQNQTDPLLLVREIERIKSKLLAEFAGERRRLYQAVRFVQTHSQFIRVRSRVWGLRSHTYDWRLMPPSSGRRNWIRLSHTFDQKRISGNSCRLRSYGTEPIEDYGLRFAVTIRNPPAGKNNARWLIRMKLVCALRREYLDRVVTRETSQFLQQIMSK